VLKETQVESRITKQPNRDLAAWELGFMKQSPYRVTNETLTPSCRRSMIAHLPLLCLPPAAPIRADYAWSIWTRTNSSFKSNTLCSTSIETKSTLIAPSHASRVSKKAICRTRAQKHIARTVKADIQADCVRRTVAVPNAASEDMTPSRVCLK